MPVTFSGNFKYCVFSVLAYKDKVDSWFSFPMQVKKILLITTV
jgi:hypothetical protein